MRTLLEDMLHQRLGKLCFREACPSTVYPAWTPVVLFGVCGMSVSGNLFSVHLQCLSDVMCFFLSCGSAMFCPVHIL